MALFEDREFETPPTIAAATGSAADTIRGAINKGELEAHNFGSKKRPSWKVSRAAWVRYLELKSSIANGKGARKKRAKAKQMVSVKEYV